MSEKIPEVIYQPKDAMAVVDNLKQTIDALIKERDWYHERSHKADRLEQRVAELEDQLRDMTAACELWKEKAIPEWVQTKEEPPLSTRTGLPAIKLLYEPEEVGQGRSIAVTLLDHSIDYVLENVRWFLSMVYMWDMGELELKQVEDEEEN